MEGKFGMPLERQVAPEVDKNKSGITGNSRNGKQALLAAAFDERISAVVPSSGNTGECLPWCYIAGSLSDGKHRGHHRRPAQHSLVQPPFALFSPGVSRNCP
jgi:hypothetical protein